MNDMQTCTKSKQCRKKNHAKKFAKKMICNAEFDNREEKNKGEEEKKI